MDHKITSDSAYGPNPSDVTWRRATRPVTKVDAEHALNALVWAQGNPSLAAENLGLPTADSLLAAMALDEQVHERARAVFRFYQLTSLLGTIQHVQDDLLEALPSMDTGVKARLYTSLIQAAELLTKGAAAPSGTGNVFEMIMRSAPPHVRASLKVLLANSEDAVSMDDDNVTYTGTNTTEPAA